LVQQLAYARQEQANQFIIGTEMGLIHRLNQENPDNQFYSPTEYLLCPTMKMTNLEKVLLALEKMERVVTISERVRVGARKALDAMLTV
jgi:quinolinate synthase